MNYITWTVAGVASAILAHGAGAQNIGENRFTFSGRAAFNVKASFGAAPFSLASAPRITPDGDAYNYDDGYILTDYSGNFEGLTWYWGYDSSAQIVGDTIGLSRFTAPAEVGGNSFRDDPQLGAELTYNRLFLHWEGLRFGVEGAVNYLNISMRDNSRASGFFTKATDFFPFTPGTTPPAGPYEGSFGGPGFVIGDTPTGSTVNSVLGANILDEQRFDGDLWGLRLGPFVEFPLHPRATATFSVGPALGVLRSDVSWTQTTSLIGGGTVRSSAADESSKVLWGWYVNGTVSWLLTPRLDLTGGLQYQYLNNFERRVGGRKVELDFSNAIFISLGLGYRF